MNPVGNKTEADKNNGEKQLTISCRYCKNKIALTAKVCHHCGRYQNMFLQHFRIEWIGILTSVVMMTIALVQLQAARIERNAAQKALEQANTALEAVRAVQKNILALNKEASLALVRDKKVAAEAKLGRLRQKYDELEEERNHWFFKGDNLKAGRCIMELAKLGPKIAYLEQEIAKWGYELTLESDN